MSALLDNRAERRSRGVNVGAIIQSVEHQRGLPDWMTALAFNEQFRPLPFAVAPRAPGPELNVIVPTFHECDNIEPLL